ARRRSAHELCALTRDYVEKILLMIGLAKRKPVRCRLGLIMIDPAGRRLSLVGVRAVVLPAIVVGNERARGSRRVAVARVARRRLRCTRIAAVLRRVGCSKR